MLKEINQKQKNHIRNIKQKLEKNSCVLDTSNLGTGKTYSAAIISQNYNNPLVISTPTVLNKWKGIKEKHESLNKLQLLSLYQINKLQNIENIDFIIIDEIQYFKNSSKRTNYLIELMESIKSIDILAISSTPIDKKRQLVNILRIMKILDTDLYIYRRDLQIYIFEGYNKLFEKFENSSKFKRKDYLIIKLRNSDYINKKSIFDSVYDLYSKCIKFEIGVCNKIKNDTVVLKETETVIQVKTQEAKDALIAMEEVVVRSYGEDVDRKDIFNQFIKAFYNLELNKMKEFSDMIYKDIEKFETKKFVIMCNYRNSLEFLKNYLESRGIYPLILDGSIKMDRRSEIIDKFMEDNYNHRVIIGNIQVLSTGIDLDDKYGDFERKAYIFPSYNSITIKQALHRFHRLDTKSNSEASLCYIKNDSVKESRLIKSLKTKFEIIKETT